MNVTKLLVLLIYLDEHIIDLPSFRGIFSTEPERLPEGPKFTEYFGRFFWFFVWVTTEFLSICRKTWVTLGFQNFIGNNQIDEFL